MVGGCAAGINMQKDINKCADRTRKSKHSFSLLSKRILDVLKITVNSLSSVHVYLLALVNRLFKSKRFISPTIYSSPASDDIT